MTDNLFQLIRSCSWNGRGNELGHPGRDFKCVLMKKNPKRQVFQITENGNPVYYLKIFKAQVFPFSMIRFYAEKEFNTGIRLKNDGIRTVEYVSWAKLPSGEGLCLTAAMNNAVSGREQFFRNCRFDTEKRRLFLDSMSALVASLVSMNYFHPDLHSGNFLSDCQLNTALVDVWGIRKISLWTRRKRAVMTAPWLDLEDFLSEDEIISGLVAGKLAKDADDAKSLWAQANAEKRAGMPKRIRKLRCRVMRPESKFTKVIIKNGEIQRWRKTPWYSDPESLEIDPAWKKISLPNEAEAENMWVESFINPANKEYPVLWVSRDAGRENIFYMNSAEVRQ